MKNKTIVTYIFIAYLEYSDLSHILLPLLSSAKVLKVFVLLSPFYI